MFFLLTIKNKITNAKSIEIIKEIIGLKTENNKMRNKNIKMINIEKRYLKHTHAPLLIILYNDSVLILTIILSIVKIFKYFFPN